MDIYQIMARLDAIGSKKTLAESQNMAQPVTEVRSVSEIDELYQEWVSSEDAPFDSDSGDQNTVLKKAMRFLNGRVRPDQIEDIADMLTNQWHGGEGVMSEERRSPEEFDADALAKHKARLAREKQKIGMQRKISGQDSGKPPVVREAGEAFAKGDRVMYLNGFATVVGQDEDAYVVKVDGQSNTMKVPATAIKKPSYNEGVAKSEKAKKDYDGDGKIETGKDEYMGSRMKAAGKNDAKGSFQKQMGGSAKDLTKGLSIGAKKVSERHDKMDEADVEEGNKFAHNVLKAKAAGIKKADLDGDGDKETVREMFPGTTEYELRFGKDDAASAFDKKKISTGTVYSRRYQDEPEADDDAPRAAGRPKGSKRRLGAKGPGVNSKLLKGKGGLKEQDIDIRDRGEYDREGDMALNQVHQIADAARELHAILASDDNLPEWVQAKITKALDYIDTARDYLGAEGEMDREELPEIAPIVGAALRAAAPIAARALGPTAMGVRAAATPTPVASGELPKPSSSGSPEVYLPPASSQEKTVDETGYSAKAARAGKDIGKPGKNFSKIAKGAAERYGSKEAGERVAGAVLNKLRAKEGVEEGPDTGIGSKLPKSDIETFGLQKGRPYKINPPQDFKPGDRKRAVQQLIPTQDKKDHIRSRLGKHVAPVLPEQDVEEGGKDRTAGKKSGVPSSISTAELKAELKRRTQTNSESTDTRDQHAEKAGKKVTKDLEYDMKHKGKDDAKAEKAGKKVTRDIEYDDKKDKEKKVDETTVSGSVATGGDAPKKSKGGMQFGKGVYEGAIAESFDKKLGGILTEGMSVNVSTDDTGKKSISVNATDADADSLGQMLKMAGLFSSEGYSRTCESCHGIHEAGACGAQQVEEELANSPDEVYTNPDYMTQTLSGGLNGPKTTGQTTGPIVNQQPGRQGVMAEAERVVEQSESRLWNLYKQYEKK